ncbi:hypothetical protein ACIQMR_35285 [Streptomyces sp. NPDC091376]|uniref:hypothetical protein n=1 Tax=Streptomyces sp. NPDC091376 TaxID=3365994 RepID=UPI00381992EB
MRRHLSGLHGGFAYTPEEVTRMLSDLQVWTPIRITPKEADCYTHCDHDPHDVRGGRCYGNGPFRQVPRIDYWPPLRGDEDEED